VRPLVPPLTVIALAVLASPAHAGFLTGRSEYDTATHLFTYTYTLDNTAGSWPVTELSVLIAPGRVAFDLRPPAWSAPPGWVFGTSASGSIADPPYNEFGTFWFWDNPDGLPVGDRAEFTFTSSYGPTGGGNNYFVFAPGAARDGRNGVIEYGHTVAPVVTPEPTTVTLCGAALGLLGVASGVTRRGRRAGRSR
jgi:hypothetical protein